MKMGETTKSVKVNVGHSKFLNELSQKGKARLMLIFEKPYFQTSIADYCDFHNENTSLQSRYNDALINADKQKWTWKDIRYLKESIREVIIDAEVKKYTDRYTYLLTKIKFDKTVKTKSVKKKNSTDVDAVGKVRRSRRNQSNSEKSKSDSNSKSNAKTQQSFEFHINFDESIKLVTVTAEIPIYEENEIKTWYQKNKSRIQKLTYASLMKDSQYIDLIDWYKVAKNLTTKSGKERNANDCFLAWRHEANPAVNCKSWSVAEDKKLKANIKHQGELVDWDETARKAGNNRTPYQCFHRYRNQPEQIDFTSWDDLKSQKMIDVLINEGAKWIRALDATGDIRLTKQQVLERWKKSCSPVLRLGSFTRVEDALLLLQIERLKEFILKERNFGVLFTYLPWRNETVWKERGNHLFKNWIVPWTKEEDELLLKLVKTQGAKKDWQAISSQFTSFKNRKGCLTRHKILTNRIGLGKKYSNLAEYHEAYSMFRYNVFEYKHLSEIIDLLKKVDQQKPPQVPFPGLESDRPPEENELRYMLLDFDREVLKRVIKNLESYIKSRDENSKEWNETKKFKKTFDRRSFRPEDPQSVASALHLRDVQLKPKDEIKHALSQFEEDVLVYYARFCRTKAVKKNIERPYLPSATKLKQLKCISGIIQKKNGKSKANVKPAPKRPGRKTRSKKVATPKSKSKVVKKTKKKGRRSPKKQKKSLPASVPLFENEVHSSSLFDGEAVVKEEQDILLEEEPLLAYPHDFHLFLGEPVLKEEEDEFYDCKVEPKVEVSDEKPHDSTPVVKKSGEMCSVQEGGIISQSRHRKRPPTPSESHDVPVSKSRRFSACGTQ